jgi:ribonuclease BN (tRNA processing enzyme)
MPTIFELAHSRAPQTAGCGAPLQEVQAALKNPRGTKLVILGSGAGPNPTVPGRTRRMTSHVIVSNATAYVLDCGLGVTNQFARTGIPFTAVRSIFITHHHPDHNIEYGPFLLLGWVQGLPNSLRAFGPPPLKQMTEDFLRAYKATIDFWVEDLKVKPLVSPEVKEVLAPRQGRANPFRRLHGAHEGRSFAGRRCRPHCAKGGGQNPSPLAPDARHRRN